MSEILLAVLVAGCGLLLTFFGYIVSWYAWGPFFQATLHDRGLKFVVYTFMGAILAGIGCGAFFGGLVIMGWAIYNVVF